MDIIRKIEEADRKIEVAVKGKYGLNAERYASGFNVSTGMREASYDIFREDGTRFVVDARFDPDSKKVLMKERQYVEWK